MDGGHIGLKRLLLYMLVVVQDGHAVAVGDVEKVEKVVWGTSWVRVGRPTSHSRLQLLTNEPFVKTSVLVVVTVVARDLTDSPAATWFSPQRRRRHRRRWSSMLQLASCPDSQAERGSLLQLLCTLCATARFQCPQCPSIAPG